MHRGLLQETTAFGLTVLLTVLATGLPSHHHDDSDSNGWSVVGTDHHDHGVLLVEQPERIQGQPILLSLPEHEIALAVEGSVRTRIPEAQTDRPTERAPPLTLRPRAPPKPI